jgi:acyl-CoA dehydrogenase
MEVDIRQSAKSADLGERIRQFMADHIYPNERRFYQEAERLGPWAALPVVEELKSLAHAARLWNLFLPVDKPGGLSNLEYAPLCETMGAPTSHPRCSTAAHPTLATWRRSCATGLTRRRRPG